MITIITLVIIVAMSLFTNWPKCTTELMMKGEQEVWSTVCRPRGSPFALFFSLLVIVIIQIWAVYIAEMYRLRYKELHESNEFQHLSADASIPSSSPPSSSSSSCVFTNKRIIL